jgi:predicted branched-subunit amino acid permease
VNPSPSSSVRTGFLLGARAATGLPAAAMTAGFIGFGSLAGDAGLPFSIAALSTVFMWALPGQLVMVEMIAVKAALLVTFFAVMMSAVRLLPMALTISPLIRVPGAGWRTRLHEYAAAHFIATTAWALGMRDFPNLPVAQRAPWMLGFGVVCTVAALACCAFGYYAADTLPREIRIALVFLTPLYFVILLAGDLHSRALALSFVCGALAGPAFYRLSPEWGVVLTGVVGGTTAFLLHKLLPERAA